MLVKFSSKAAPDMLMFGDVALALLKKMGHSGTVPSALTGARVGEALATLTSALAADPSAHSAPADQHAADKDNDEDHPERSTPGVSLAQRAVPLIDMLRRAAAAGVEVMVEYA